MEFTEFVRKPFRVEAAQITEENFDEVASLIGTRVGKTRSGDRFIVLDRRIIPQGTKAWVGWWVTKMGDYYRCYPRKPFADQFEEMTSEWDDILKPLEANAESQEVLVGANLTESVERVEEHGTPAK
jgi:hypothetical protein